MNDTEVKSVWRNSFAEVGYSYLINQTIRRNSKIKYLLSDIGLGGVLNYFQTLRK